MRAVAELELVRRVRAATNSRFDYAVFSLVPSQLDLIRSRSLAATLRLYRLPGASQLAVFSVTKLVT